MALPLSTGANPEEVVIAKDTWTKAFADVKSARVSRRFSAKEVMWLTYVNVGDPVPTDLDVPKWRVENNTKFLDALTGRDIFLYAVDENLAVTVES